MYQKHYVYVNLTFLCKKQEKKENVFSIQCYYNLAPFNFLFFNISVAEKWILSINYLQGINVYTPEMAQCVWKCN